MTRKAVVEALKAVPFQPLRVALALGGYTPFEQSRRSTMTVADLRRRTTVAADLGADGIREFWQLVRRTRTCWEWQGSRNDAGYGLFHKRPAHRAAYAIEHGMTPAEWMVCHHCDNPSCVRPSHLFLGTAADNVHDMLAKGRHKLRIGPRSHLLRKGVAA